MRLRELARLGGPAPGAELVPGYAPGCTRGMAGRGLTVGEHERMARIRERSRKSVAHGRIAMRNQNCL